jgi:hypothetical protein
MPTPRESLQSTASRVALRVGELSIRRRLLVAQLADIDVELERAYKHADSLDQAAQVIEPLPTPPPPLADPEKT